MAAPFPTPRQPGGSPARRRRVAARPPRFLTPPAPGGMAPAEAPLIAGAGDIAGTGTGAERTAQLLDALGPDAVLTTGDNAYPDGTATDYSDRFAPTWGRHKAITKPVPGTTTTTRPARPRTSGTSGPRPAIRPGAITPTTWAVGGCMR